MREPEPAEWSPGRPATEARQLLLAQWSLADRQAGLLFFLGWLGSSLGALKEIVRRCDLMVTNDVLDPTMAEWQLFVLTHHHLPRVTYFRTPEQTHEGWQQWWDAGGKNAPLYSPFECALKDAL